jgi:hypothetical protein
MGHLLVAPNTQVSIIPAPRRNKSPFQFVDGNAVMFIQPAELVKEGAGEILLSREQTGKMFRSAGGG